MDKDLFSAQAADYARYRPSYPKELIDYILSFVKAKENAWDCATGNGQAAVLIAPYFKQVCATDSSQRQLDQALQKTNIRYSLSKSEQTQFPNNHFDLITVAQAYHWFDFALFEKEVKRVGKPGAIIACWGYNIPFCEEPMINDILLHFYTAVVGKYWDPERRFVEAQLKTVPFHFEEIPSNTFRYSLEWALQDLQGYLNSWSSVQHFIRENQFNPVEDITREFAAAWPGNHSILTFRFPIFLRIGRLPFSN